MASGYAVMMPLAHAGCDAVGSCDEVVSLRHAGEVMPSCHAVN